MLDRVHTIRRIAISLLLVVLFAGDATAQEAPAYRLEDVAGFLAAGVPADAILSRLNRDCIDFQVDEAAEQRLRAAGADDDFMTRLRSVCFRGAEVPEQVEPEESAAPLLPYSPGSAMLRSFLLPGLGQLYTDRPLLGGLVFAGWATALGVGLLSEEIAIECLARVSDVCPVDQVRGEVSRRPLLGPAVGVAIGIAVFSAIEARAAAKRANLLASDGSRAGSPEQVGFDIRPALDFQPVRGLVLSLQFHF